MKVQKIVSLTPATATIAEGMNNFSRFVRVALIAYEEGNDFETVKNNVKWFRRTLRRLEVLLADRIGAEATWEMIKEAEQWAREQSTLDVE